MSINDLKLAEFTKFDSGRRDAFHVVIDPGGFVLIFEKAGGDFVALACPDIKSSSNQINSFIAGILLASQPTQLEVKAIGNFDTMNKVSEILGKHDLSASKVVFRSKAFEIAYVPERRKIQVSLELTAGESGEKPVFGNSQMDKTSTVSKIRVIIVDDSKSISDLLTRIIDSDPDLEVVGVCVAAQEVVPAIERLKPDVITMDMYLPGLDGVTLIKRIVPEYNIPIVVISSVGREDGPMVVDALEYGAVDYIQKPTLTSLASMAESIVPKLKAAARSRSPDRASPLGEIKKVAGPWDPSFCIAIGASTGGIEAIKRLLLTFPDEVPAVIIAQHIPAIFSDAFSRRLASLVPFEVREAAHSDWVIPNTVLIAPGGKDISVVKDSRGTRISLSEPDERHIHHPSVDQLFMSTAQSFGERSIGIVLTGMGTDGSMGLGYIKSAGGSVFAQSADSAVASGMPKSAIDTGFVDAISGLEELSLLIDKKIKIG